MIRKIKINNSDKIICKYFDNGYCRFREDCKFFHPAENCDCEQCDLRTCVKRHPKQCKYFRRKRCKFGDDCFFKHINVKQVNEYYAKEVDDEKDELKKELKQMEDIIKNLRNENAHKDVELDKRLKDIEKKDQEIIDLKNENNILLKAKTGNSEHKCQVCENKFKSKIDLESHTKNDHIRYFERSKEFLARLQDMSNGYIFMK